MLATMSQQAPITSNPIAHSSAPKRPRLSLQTIAALPSTPLSKSGTAPKANIDTTSATAFNTLSNAYAAAIELSSPKITQPRVSLDSNNTVRKSGLRLVTNASSSQTPLFPSQHTQTPGPFTIIYPDSPGAVFSATSPSATVPELWSRAPTYTFTPPHSAQPLDESTANPFSFTRKLTDTAVATSPRTPRRRATTGTQNLAPPYTHPRSLHSILRNSPLPPKSSLTPISPSRASRRLADRVAKKLCFNNPLTQTITTQRYIKSHVDLLAEDASPYSASESEAEISETLDLTMAYTGDETRDGGQTPGPFEEMRRRMAGLQAESEKDMSANRKRKRKEKKRQWVWTIGTNEDEEQIPTATPEAESMIPNLPPMNLSLHMQQEKIDFLPFVEIHQVHEVLGETPLKATEVKFDACDRSKTYLISRETSKLAALEPVIHETSSLETGMDIIFDTETADRPCASHSI